MELSDGINIASYSMNHSQNTIMQNIGIQLLKNALDIQEIQGSEMIQLMEQSVNPELGQNIDIRV